MSTSHTGGCLCGKVRYEAPSTMKTAGKCHCTQCQRATGTSNFTAAVFALDDFKVTGETKSYTYTSDAGNPVTHHFCPNCGSKLYISNPVAFPGLALVYAGTLDDSTDLEPQFVVYDKRRPAWDGDNPNIPHFPEMPPG